MRILPGFLEGAYGNYVALTRLAEPPLVEPMAVYMLGSRMEWTHLSAWVFGPDAPHNSINAGGYSYRGIGVYWDLHGRATLSVAAHEGMHQFLYYRLRNRLPLCLGEGLAVSAEGFHIPRPAGGFDDDTAAKSVVFLPGRNPQRFNALRSAIVNGRWTPIGKLLEMDAADYLPKGQTYTLGWYGQVWALMQLLQSDPVYRRRLQRMLTDAQEGRFHVALRKYPQFRNVTAAGIRTLQRRPRIYNRTLARPLFEHYIQRDLKLFERRYKAFARKLADLPPGISQ